MGFRLIYHMHTQVIEFEEHYQLTTATTADEDDENESESENGVAVAQVSRVDT